VSGPLAIVLFFLGVVVVILVHELGHYLVARRFGFQVLEYFVGFGPRLWSTRRDGIEYGMKAFPLGGYVKIAGMNPWETVAPEDVPRAYFSKPAWQRALMIFAGPGSHVIVALLLFAASFWIFGQEVPREHLQISQVQRINDGASPALDAGIQPGDELLMVGDVRSPDSEQLQQVLRANVGQQVEVVVLRGGRALTVSVTPELAEVDGREIARMGVIVDLFESQAVGPVEGLVLGAGEVGSATVSSVQTVGRVFGPEGIGSVFRALFTDTPRDVEGPTSVVGIGQAVGEAGQEGEWFLILQFLGYVTVFIGLLNLLPLPPFDGGHLALIAIERCGAARWTSAGWCPSRWRCSRSSRSSWGRRWSWTSPSPSHVRPDRGPAGQHDFSIWPGRARHDPSVRWPACRLAPCWWSTTRRPSPKPSGRVWNPRGSTSWSPSTDPTRSASTPSTVPTS
jgi:membrane-associated protease RseP (regulator of RpoE activity)